MLFKKSLFTQFGFSEDVGLQKQHHFAADFVMSKHGSNYIFLQYIDYYFVRYCHSPLNYDFIEKYHKNSKKIVNKTFMLPKALRLKVPNINSVFVTPFEPSDEIKTNLSGLSKSIIGGEQDSIFIIDSKSKEVFSSGKEISKIYGEAQIVMGNQKEFKTINGRNRAHSLIDQLLQKV